MFDPLLPPPPPPPAPGRQTLDQTAPRPPRVPSHLRGGARRPKHPALSARILAVGLSTTAMLGLTAGYALAGRTTTEQPLNDQTTDPALAPPSGQAASTAQQTQAPSPSRAQQPGTASQSSSRPQSPAAQSQTPVQQAPAVNQPQVVEVPVAPAEPAQPGTSGGGTPQPSSGSH